MTTKSPSCKQIIVSVGNKNISRFMASSSEYISNLNKVLKDIKMDIFIDFIRSDHCNLVVISNKVTSSSNLNIVKSYMKNINSVDANNIQPTCLSLPH